MDGGDGGQRVLGAAVLSRYRALESLTSAAVVDGARASLPGPVRDRLARVHAVEWVSLDEVELLNDAVAAQVGREPESFHDAVIARSVDDALLGIYRFALRFATDAWLVSRTPQIFSRTRQMGTLESVMSGLGEAELRLTGWPGMRDRYARQVAIGVERMLALTGREKPEVRHRLTADGAVMVATWSTPRAPR